jgi:hypothetical protein
MIVAAIEQSYVNSSVFQPVGGAQAAEAAAENNHSMPIRHPCRASHLFDVLVRK